jgi:hypothetical protein
MLKDLTLILLSSFLVSSLFLTPLFGSGNVLAMAEDKCYNSQISMPNVLSPRTSSTNNDSSPSVKNSVLCLKRSGDLAQLIMTASITPTSLSTSGDIDEEFRNSTIFDKFGTLKIYPTKEKGREWYMNTSEPRSDKNFITDADIEKQPNGAWRVSAEQLPGANKGRVRIEVNTSQGEEPWKNVEITGYARVVETTGHDPSVSSDLENIFQWYARGGEHSNEAPCEGTSLKGRLHLNGQVSWIKEIWHTGGYTDEKSKEKVTPHLVGDQASEGHYINGRWFGFKVVIYNINNDKSVRMEMFLDERLDNRWIKVSGLEDTGNWYSESKNFFDVDCGRPRNYVVTNSGPMVGFRSDYIIWEFKDLSVREINPL